MEKFFNIAGPCIPSEHYMLPAVARLPQVMRLIERRQYFAIHAARQSGKTTLLKALAREINASGERIALYFTVESVQAYPDPHDGIAKIVEQMRTDLLGHPLFGEIARNPAGFMDASDEILGVKLLLSMIARKAGKPLVVLFDEVDGLTEGTAVTFLRELRNGYITRDNIPFPSSVAIVGMMDIRDMKAKVRPHSDTLGSKSPFNVIAEDFTLNNFTEDEVRSLYAQHTEATGQVFEPEAVAEAYMFTLGQPWLVNAIAQKCVDKIHEGRYDEHVTAADVEAAKEAIIRERGTHVDSLMDRLKEDRVRRVVEPVMLGEGNYLSEIDDDYRYVIDLGLMRENERHALVPGNPMYGEIMLRYLSASEQKRFYNEYETPFWLKADGSLDMSALMSEFQKFWRENAESYKDMYGYREAMPHLVMMAFLQRVVNGGGRIFREMALGSSRLDLCVEFGKFRYAVELKMRRMFSPEKSYPQLLGYLDKLGLDEGWMAVFDEDKTKPWDEKIFLRDELFGSKTIHVVGL